MFRALYHAFILALIIEIAKYVFVFNLEVVEVAKASEPVDVESVETPWNAETVETGRGRGLWNGERGHCIGAVQNGSQSVKVVDSCEGCEFGA